MTEFRKNRKYGTWSVTLPKLAVVRLSTVNVGGSWYSCASEAEKAPRKIHRNGPVMASAARPSTANVNTLLIERPPPGEAELQRGQQDQHDRERDADGRGVAEREVAERAVVQVL